MTLTEGAGGPSPTSGGTPAARKGSLGQAEAAVGSGHCHLQEMPQPVPGVPSSPVQGSSLGNRCHITLGWGRGWPGCCQSWRWCLRMACGPLPPHLLSQESGGAQTGNPRRVWILFPRAPVEAMTFPRWVWPGQCSSFSAPSRARLPSNRPTHCTFLFLRGLCGFRFFSCSKGGQPT